MKKPDITKLPEKWRSTHSGFDGCAWQLESALPKWTRITDDPDTWPEDGQRIIYTNNTPTPYIVQWHSSYVDIYLGLRWRPLCDLDYPPKGEGDES